MSNDPLVGKILHDTHEVLRLIGMGGMGRLRCLYSTQEEQYLSLDNIGNKVGNYLPNHRVDIVDWQRC